MNSSYIAAKMKGILFAFLCSVLPLHVASTQEFVIGVEDVQYFPLFDFKSNKNTFSKEVMDAFAKSKGYKFTYLPLPIKRFERWLLEHKIDFKFPDNIRWYPDPSLRSQFTFSDPVLKLVAGTTVLETFLDKDKESFRSIGTLLGFYPTTWIDQIKNGDVILHEEVSTKLLVRKLVEGHLDGIDIEPSVIQHYLKELNVDTNVAVIDKRYRYDVYDFHFSTLDHPEVIKEFNQFIKDEKELINRLKEKYKIIDHLPFERSLSEIKQN